MYYSIKIIKKTNNNNKRENNNVRGLRGCLFVEDFEKTGAKFSKQA